MKYRGKKLALGVGTQGLVTWAKMAWNRPHLWCHSQKNKYKTFQFFL